MLTLHIIGSGSKGNCAIVEDTASGHGIMIDCGICKRDVFGRSAKAGFELANFDGIMITHDHSDHTKCLGVVLRGLKRTGFPLYILPGVDEASAHVREALDYADVEYMECGSSLNLGGIDILPFATSHDAAASCGFRFLSSDGDALGYVTDTGFLTPEAVEALQDVRLLALESNHDTKMLKESPYPFMVKERIASEMGHLSNDQSADALKLLASERLEAVCAMHLSENNNLPSLARESLERAVEETGYDIKVKVASQRMLVSLV